MKKIYILLLLSLCVFIPFIVKADSASDYNAQYQAVQEKIKPLQDQFNALQAICPSLSQAGGEEGIKCLLAASQAGDVGEYINAIQNDFLTPVTDLSITYENKLDNLHQQIFQVKMDYHQQVANINSSPGDMTLANGEQQIALTAANAKINALSQQIQFTLQDYQNALTNQQMQQQTCPANSYNSNGQCFCNDGYVQSGNTCIPYNQACQNQYGANSYGDKNGCYCGAGYQWNSSRTVCVDIICPAHSSISGNQCACNSGYILSSNECITYAQNCQNRYGTNSYGDQNSCYCNSGYQWNQSKTACIQIITPIITSTPIPTQTPISTLTSIPTPLFSAKPLPMYIPINNQLPKASFTPSPITPTPSPKSINIFTRFFNWIKGIFKK